MLVSRFLGSPSALSVAPAAGLAVAALTLACASSPRSVPETTVAVPPAQAQRATPPAETQGAFIVRLGNDTVGVEQYRRTATTLEGELVVRTPRTRVIRYQAGLGPAGRVVTFEASGTLPPGGAPSQPTRLEFTGDTVVALVPAGDSLRLNRMDVPGIAVPWIGNSFALAEQAIRQAMASGRDSVTILQVGLGGQTPTAAYVRRRGPNTVELEYFGAPVVVRLDGAGRIVSADGRATASKITVERVPSLNVAALAADFADRPLGQLSGRDTARATIAGATLSVDYGRPSARGRTIWGGLVPWNEVWRTGANTATHFTTSRELAIAGTTVPAGTYTLWTLPTPQGVQLILNRQTGQWGTSYDPAQDLARIPVSFEATPEHMEQFTIAFAPSGEGGVMRLIWADRAIVVPFAVK